jgi:hypothetical protein
MTRHAKKGLAFAAFMLGLSLPAPVRAVPSSVKYDFTPTSPNVVLSGGNLNFCGPGTYLNGTAVVTFNDSYVGGNPVTAQVGIECSQFPMQLTVNGSLVGTFPAASNTCCNNAFFAPTMTITSAYNNGSSAKTLSLNINSGNGNIMPITGLFNTSDPMFRIVVGLLPGVSTPTPGGFTNQVIPLFSWAALPGAASYELQVSSDPFFNSPMVLDASGIPGTSYQLAIANQLVNGASYYTRLKASGGIDNGVWSYISDFTVAQTIPSTPVLVSPPNPSIVSSQTPTFNWNPVTLGTE